MFIARHFPRDRFAATSGTVLALGGIGMIATGTPLAWLVEATSWRMAFWVLAVSSAASWALIAWRVQESAPSEPAPGVPRESLGHAALTFLSLFRLPYTAGIMALSFVCYAAFISLRGLWLGPMLIERHGFSLTQSGTVALAVSVVSLISPVLFGRFDPGDGRRRGWLLGWTLLTAAAFACMAPVHGAAFDVTTSLALGMLSGFIVLQYSDVRAVYPSHIVGRALALFTMAMFLGVAVMQWLTGWVASIAKAHGVEIYAWVFLSISGLLVLGALGFAFLPRARRAVEVPQVGAGHS